MVSLLGLITNTTVTLAAPLSPGFVPTMDIGLVFAVVVWGLLLKRYYGSGWLESFLPALIAAIIHAIIITIAASFSALLLRV